MDLQGQEERSEANMQTEGSRGKEKVPSEVSSKHPLSSSKSSVASAAAKTRASAEAACAKMAFAKRQLEMKKEKARLEQVKSSHLYLYSAFNNTNCNKALHNIKIGKLCQ